MRKMYNPNEGNLPVSNRVDEDIYSAEYELKYVQCAKKEKYNPEDVYHNQTIQQVLRTIKD